MSRNLHKIAEYMRGQRERLAELFEQGASYNQAAAELGVGRATITKYAKRWGLSSKNPRPATCHYITYQGERMSIAEAAQRAGLHPDTLRDRIVRGLPEHRWFQPARRYTTAPRYYALDLPLSEWRMYADLAREIGPKAVHDSTGLPYGAITAAMRGEEDRLG